MSTRCRIGKVLEDGSVKSIYCHHDGYPEYVGQILKDCYDFYNIEDLLNLGDLSVLGENIHPTEKSHSFEHPEYGVCVGYHRDRGEDYIPPRIDKSIDDYIKNKEDLDIEYKYLLDENDDWWVYPESTYEEDESLYIL